MEPTTLATVTTIIAHGPCPDGAAAMWVVRRWLKQSRPGAKIRWIMARPGDDLPELRDDFVLILDYSYNKEKTLTLLTKVKGLMILDHHKTNQADLASLPDHLKIFDMNRSGCGIAWDYCFPETKMPMFLQCIQDRDIWQYKLAESNNFGNYMQILDLTDIDKIFQTFDKLEDPDAFGHACAKGACFAELNQNYIDWATSKVDISLCKIGNKYYQVGTVNSTILKSEIGNAIMIKNPFVDFSVVYSTGPTYTNFSLRSTNDKADVSEIAKIYGGGGHRNASGVHIESVNSRLPAIYFDIDLSKHISLAKQSSLTIQDQTIAVTILEYPRKRFVVASYLAQNSRSAAVCVGKYDWTNKKPSYIVKPTSHATPHESKLLESYKFIEL